MRRSQLGYMLRTSAILLDECAVTSGRPREQLATIEYVCGILHMIRSKQEARPPITTRFEPVGRLQVKQMGFYRSGVMLVRQFWCSQLDLHPMGGCTLTVGPPEVLLAGLFSIG